MWGEKVDSHTTNMEKTKQELQYKKGREKHFSSKNVMSEMPTWHPSGGDEWTLDLELWI